MKKKIIAVFLLPVLWLHLLLRFHSKFSDLYRQDKVFTKEYRGNPFVNKVLEFAYFIIYLPEYRSVFYYRCGIWGRVVNLYLPIQKQLYIKTLNIRGGETMCQAWTLD